MMEILLTNRYGTAMIALREKLPRLYAEREEALEISPP